MKKLITLISLIAIVSLLASLLVLPASAETLNGTCGENLTYTFNTNTGELVISGTGAIKNSPDWKDYKTSITKITINEGVTSIPSYTFSSYSKLKEISIPSTVQEIGEYAFSDCLLLDGVVLPAGITAINKFTFAECYALSSIVIPDSVTTIKEGAFSGCGALKIVNIGSGVTTIEENAFAGCSKMSTLFLPAGVTSIHNTAFASSTKLEVINFYCGTQAQWDAIKSNFKTKINPNFHANSGNEIMRDPTATDPGAIGYVCDACGEEIILETIPATGEITEAETTAAETEAETTAAEEKSGCGSFIAGSAVMVALTSVIGAAYVAKRKED